MEADLSAPIRNGANPATAGAERSCQPAQGMDGTRVTKETLQALLEECRRALELLGKGAGVAGNEEDDRATLEGPAHDDSSAFRRDQDADELCDLLKSRVMCSDFLEKSGCVQMSVAVPQYVGAAEGSSWYVVSDNDLWDGGTSDLDGEEYVMVRKEDIVEGIAGFMAAYLLSLEQTKDLSPDQLQKVLSKTFSAMKNKGKLHGVWDGSKVIYNMASWVATAVGIYQNPIILNATSKAFWTSYHVVSKFL